MQSSFLRRAAMLALLFTLGSALAVAPATAQRRVPRPSGPGGGNNPRLPAGSVVITGTITMLGANASTIQITTDHGTAVTLTTNASTQVQPNGTVTALANLAAGQQIQAIYKPADKIALILVAANPPVGVLSGAITAIDPTGGTLQITPLIGSPQTVKLNAQTQLALNGRPIAPDSLAVGQLAAVRSAADGTVRAVVAQTPPLVNLLGTITALNVAGGTLEVTTQAASSITLQFVSSLPVQLDGTSSSVDKLAVGDSLAVQYEFRLLPGTSRALAIVAKSAAAPATPTPTPTPTPSVPVASVSLNPTSVKGGTSSTGTVTLSAAAPANGALVTLASSNPTAAAVPGSVTVAAGATTGTFTVTTTAVTANTSAVIFAASGGATGMATLTVTP
jgi:trimeric autotransporter adhesin